MSPEFQNRAELEERIRMLEQENEHLADRAEQSLMLGLVSEAIGQLEDVTEMLDVALERISMLKAIPFVACCERQAEHVRVIHSYLSFSHADVNDYCFQMVGGEKESLFVNDPTALILAFLKGSGIDFTPNQVLIIPFSTQAVADGFYLFADRDTDRGRLHSITPILQRITDLLTVSMDNRGLLASYQILNAELDLRVEKRTRELQESECKYAALVEGSDAAIMLMHDNHFVDCNAATLRMFDCPSKVEFFKLHPGIVSPECQPNGVDSFVLANQYIAMAVQQGAMRFDWIHQRLNGEIFHADVHLSCIEINKQALIQAVVIDISERVKTETALHRSEQNYRDIIDNMQDCLYRTDREGRLIFASPSVATLMVCEPDEILGDYLSDYYVEPKQRHEFLRQLSSSASGDLTGFETQVRRKDGEIIWLSANSHFIYDDLGEVAGVEGTLRDISAVKRSEEALRKLSQAVEHAGESIVIMDNKGVVEYVNSAFTLMSGYASEEVLGNTLRLLQSGMQDASFYAQLWQTITAGEPWRNSLIDRHKDGTLYPVLMSVSPILNAAGVITHYVAIQRDMTELAEMEKKFNQAQKMEAIGALVSGIAHDFNNMLAGMIGSMYLIKQKLQGHTDVLERIESLEKQSFRAADMIKQLLLFARKGNMEFQSLSFSSLMKEVFKLTRVTIPENITVTLNVCDESLEIMGDASLLQQILMNLMNNARDAVADMTASEIHVEVDAFQADAAFVAQHADVVLDAIYARLSVRDNGHGISEVNLQKVFEPFYTTKEVGEGTGLGLAMIFGSVQSHHGVIDVQSECGKGTEFSLYFPLESDVEHDVVDADTTTTIAGHGEMILMVDDEASLRTVHAELLTRLGYHVLQAADGVEAAAIFKLHQHEIQLLISDVVMPHCGGVELAHRIWKQKPAMPVLFMTGYDQQQLANISKDKQPQIKILLKPCSIALLSQHIHSILQTS